jgi:hypothetical protein
MALPDIETIKQRLARMTEEELRQEMWQSALSTLIVEQHEEGPAAILFATEYMRAFSIALFDAATPRLRKRLIEQGCPDVDAEISAQRAEAIQSCNIAERQTLAACGIHPRVASMQ